ncbi:maleylpyruvate isomerase family mycothiol-dependent enzyme [Mycolicibacterium sp. 018/SC-01/001]|uniref:maleylpyruvate isomerase family mycothiol-dependent enzyme n=1 Tax=Mycolicibacterium sp. 018/SC-01/001 TaxID=2592069 RepID=UPI00117D3C41|nr:maleylpyruvate isomerase family mycothiol-dependent enzyme [Mycolicibacterium sp. 018/SC-01/001]TRW88248.1 maleylpyruvate isomerase family mycothiol-dependent enzyme [Mycolicibacterium sp. 018/SC-01/001]
MDGKQWAAAERMSFADLLAALDDDQWSAPSLCAGWRVRDVAIHIVAYLDRGSPAFLAGMARYRGSVDRLNTADLERLSTWSRAEVVAALRTKAEPRGVGAGFDGRIALTECMIHHQDVRRALHLPRVIAAGPLRSALGFARIAPLIRGALRTRGLSLIATDVDWTAGRGPQVRGPGEAVLMAMAGRPDALSHLTGAGVRELSRRLGV